MKIKSVQFFKGNRRCAIKRFLKIATTYGDVTTYVLTPCGRRSVATAKQRKYSGRPVSCPYCKEEAA